MCTVDWTALGTWVQAVFVAGGTIFAIVQYLRYQKDERIKRTLELLNAYDRVRHLGTSGTEITPARSLALVQAAASNINAFSVGFADFVAGKQTQLGQQYILSSDAMVTITNYFNDAVRLARRNLIDKDLFLEARSYTMTLMIEPVKSLLGVEGRTYDLSDLTQFVEEARAYLEKHPAIKA